MLFSLCHHPPPRNFSTDTCLNGLGIQDESQDSIQEASQDSQDDPLSSKTPTPDFVDVGHLDRKIDILDSQDDTLSSQRLQLQNLWTGVTLKEK